MRDPNDYEYGDEGRKFPKYPAEDYNVAPTDKGMQLFLIVFLLFVVAVCIAFCFSGCVDLIGHGSPFDEHIGENSLEEPYSEGNAKLLHLPWTKPRTGAEARLPLRKTNNP